MTELDEFLSELAPGEGWIPAWEEVVARAASRANGRRARRSRRRIAALVLAVIAVALIPLVAVAASNDWWFLKHAAPTSQPSKAPVVVKQGAFSGRKWQLVAYPAADGLCWSLTFTAHGKTGQGSALACGPVVGFASKHPNPEMTITYLASSGTKTDPAWIAGPVIAAAKTVKLRFGARTLTTPTFKAPAALGHVRFYALEVPAGRPLRLKPGQRPRSPLAWLAGYDDHGRIVACLNPKNAREGISPFSSCR